MKNKKNIKITILIILTILLINKIIGTGFLDFNIFSVRFKLMILLIISIKYMIIPYIVKKKKNIKKETLIKICKINSILIIIIDEIILKTIMINNRIEDRINKVGVIEPFYIYDLAKDLIIPTIIIGIIYYFINYTLYNDEKTTKNKIKNKTDDLKMEEK